MAEFKLNGQVFQARRETQPFICAIDGMKLRGLGFDWRITRADGKSFPMPDHIFKMLFEPVDDEAKKLFNTKYSLKVGIGEGITVLDKIEKFLGKHKKSRDNVPNPGS